jgi:hypothetical protein
MQKAFAAFVFECVYNKNKTGRPVMENILQNVTHDL